MVEAVELLRGAPAVRAAVHVEEQVGVEDPVPAPQGDVEQPGEAPAVVPGAVSRWISRQASRSRALARASRTGTSPVSMPRSAAGTSASSRSTSMCHSRHRAGSASRWKAADTSRLFPGGRSRAAAPPVPERRSGWSMSRRWSAAHSSAIRPTVTSRAGRHAAEGPPCRPVFSNRRVKAAVVSIPAGWAPVTHRRA